MAEERYYFSQKEISLADDNGFIKGGRFNPRKLSNPGFSAENMDSLRKGIAKDGLNHSLIVRKEKNAVILVAGERRFRAISQLVEQDEAALKKINAGDKEAIRVLVKNPRNKKFEPALKVYVEQGIECKITDETSKKEILRQAIQENTLHESLTDYELLLQCKEMEENGFSRVEQAATLGKYSEAWISQSHSLLNGPDCLLEEMERGRLCRTAAITFLPIPVEKIKIVLDKAIALTYQEAEHKEALIKDQIDAALVEIEQGESVLNLAQFTGNHVSANKARKQVQRATKEKDKAEEKLQKLEENKKKKITSDTVNKAAKEVDGRAENLNKPQTMKHSRLVLGEIKELLSSTAQKTITNPANKKKYARRDIELVKNVMEWVLNQNYCQHPLDAIVLVDE